MAGRSVYSWSSVCVHAGRDWIGTSGCPEDGHRVQEAVWPGPAGHAAALPVERSRHGSGEEAPIVGIYILYCTDDLLLQSWVEVMSSVMLVYMISHKVHEVWKDYYETFWKDQLKANEGLIRFRGRSGSGWFLCPQLRGNVGLASLLHM